MRQKTNTSAESHEEQVMQDDEIRKLIEREFACSASEDILAAFQAVRVETYEIKGTWGYGAPREHRCWVVAEDAHGKELVVYCPTGFGPAFPWGRMVKGERSMGMDANWYAYLLEAFIESQLWRGPRPGDFELKGPGEREENE
jgi:hypothetical protein